MSRSQSLSFKSVTDKKFNYFLVKYLSVCFFSIFSLYATYTVNKDVYIKNLKKEKTSKFTHGILAICEVRAAPNSA